MKIRIITLLAMGSVFAACAENISAPVSVPTEQATASPRLKVPSKSWQEGPQDPPFNAPPEYQYGTTLTVTPSASFYQERAMGEVTVSYFGTSAVADVTLDVYKGEASVGSADGHKMKTDALLWNREIVASTAFVVSGTCNYRAHVNGRGETWIGWGGSEWAKQGDSGVAWANQPGCGSGGIGDGGGGGMDYGAMLICETTEYYSGNGEYLGYSRECRIEEMM